jgi:hypothetical protein
MERNIEFRTRDSVEVFGEGEEAEKKIHKIPPTDDEIEAD